MLGLILNHAQAVVKAQKSYFTEEAVIQEEASTIATDKAANIDLPRGIFQHILLLMLDIKVLIKAQYNHIDHHNGR